MKSKADLASVIGRQILYLSDGILSNVEQDEGGVLLKHFTDSVSQIKELLPSYWHGLLAMVPQYEELSEKMLAKKNMSSYLSTAYSQLCSILSRLYFQMQNDSQCIQWALKGGELDSCHLLDGITRNMEKEYHTYLAANLIKQYQILCQRRYEDSDSNPDFQFAMNEEEETLENFVESTVEKLITSAKATSNHDYNKDVFFKIYALTMRCKRPEYLKKAIVALPDCLLSGMRFHSTQLTDDSFDKYILKLFVNGSCKAYGLLTGLHLVIDEDCPKEFNSLEDSFNEAYYASANLILSQADRDNMARCKGGAAYQFVNEDGNSPMATAANASQTSKTIDNNNSEQTAQKDIKSVETTTDSTSVSEISVKQQQQMLIATPPSIDTGDYDLAYASLQKSINFLQPILDIWQALIILKDVRRMKMLMVWMVTGKCGNDLKRMASYEGRIMAMQLAVDLFDNGHFQLCHQLSEM